MAAFNQRYTTPSVRRWSRSIAIFFSILPIICFVTAIIIFQHPDNRFRSSDTKPDGAEDSFPLAVLGLCVSWDLIVLVKDYFKGRPVRFKKARLPDALTWTLLIISGVTTFFISKPFWFDSFIAMNIARLIEGLALSLTLLASIPHFILFVFTLRDHYVSKTIGPPKEDAVSLRSLESAHASPCQACINAEQPPTYDQVASPVECQNDEPCNEQRNEQCDVQCVGQMLARPAVPEKAKPTEIVSVPVQGSSSMNISQTGLSAQDNDGRVLGT